MAENPRPGSAANKSAPTATKKDDETRTTATQPTVHMAPGPNQPGDPVTNAAEAKMLREQQAQDEEQQKEAIKQQEEEAKRQEELFNKRMDAMKSILNSDEGFVKVEEGNSEAIGEAYKEGYVYYNNVQSGKGGLDVEERAFLSAKGFDSLREQFGPKMGKK